MGYRKSISLLLVLLLSCLLYTSKQVLDMGLYLSFAGPVTFKNARRQQEAAAYVPKDRFLIETDCPYMAPEPFRGRRNDSSFVYLMAEKIARLKGIKMCIRDRFCTFEREAGYVIFIA